jgi:hypothetical protein
MPTVNTKGKPISIKELPNALVITRNLPPLVGGMERLVWHIVDELSRDYRVHVIGPAGCGAYLPRGVTVNEVPLKPLIWYLLHAKLTALWQAFRRRPASCVRRQRAYRPLRLARRLSSSEHFAWSTCMVLTLKLATRYTAIFGAHSSATVIA